MILLRKFIIALLYNKYSNDFSYFNMSIHFKLRYNNFYDYNFQRYEIYDPENSDLVFKKNTWMLSMTAGRVITKTFSNKKIFYSHANVPHYYHRINKICIKHIQGLDNSEILQLNNNLEFNMDISKFDVNCELWCGGSLNLKKATHRKIYGKILENLKEKIIPRRDVQPSLEFLSQLLQSKRH